MSDNNYDRDKLSWREIDALKNKSRHVKNDSKDDLSSFQKREEASAKKALESLFEPKKSKREALDWKKLEKLAGGDFSKQASLFVKKHGMPREWDDLLKLLDHQDHDFVLSVLDHLRKRSTHQSKGKLDLCESKLRILKLTADHPEVIKQIDLLFDLFATRD